MGKIGFYKERGRELGITAKVEAARKLGQKTCLVELNSKGDKNMIMINKTKL
jgi:hypothetical protein